MKDVMELIQALLQAALHLALTNEGVRRWGGEPVDASGKLTEYFDAIVQHGCCEPERFSILNFFFEECSSAGQCLAVLSMLNGSPKEGKERAWGHAHGMLSSFIPRIKASLDFGEILYHGEWDLDGQPTVDKKGN